MSVLAVASTTIAALVIVFGASYAAASTGPATQYTATSPNGSIVSTLKNAAFVSRGNVLTVVDSTGRTIDHVSQSVSLNGVSVPLRVNVDASRTRATFTPTITPQSRAAIALGLHPAAAKDDAYNKMIWHINNGWNRGGGVAAAVGALVGLIVGCAVIVGCIWGAGVGAGIGAAIGINQGDPLAGQAVLNWINTP
ncbi:hypothetical protein [Jongsikchunia kroppenstedtii]|uniref:hypothetical protein n=1 Tax=Jongsikchunia kroppenstedtii TaxID=1121721 RepID=UPI000369FBE2|nr:hypothetical protein [Jongsikchunia kroppenstedtii]